MTHEDGESAPEAVADGGTDTVTTLSFTYTGGLNRLLSRLAEFELLDVDIEEAPLEAVFMGFYGTVEVDA